jgi:hypothetical protein
MLLGEHAFEYKGVNLTFNAVRVDIVPEGFGTFAF